MPIKLHRYTVYTYTVLNHSIRSKILWRRDKKDIEVVESLTLSERARLINENRHSEAFVITYYMEIYEKDRVYNHDKMLALL